MSKQLGSVELNDNDGLHKIIDVNGVSYIDDESFWQEAIDIMDDNGTDSAEVRLIGLNYVEVYR